MCAIRAFGEMGTDTVTKDATYLLSRIERLGCSEVSERDMHKACQSRFKTKPTMTPAIQRLVEHGYLVPLPTEPTGGRPASPLYRVIATAP